MAERMAQRRFDSICDLCLMPAPGYVEPQGQDVYLMRNCPQHGLRRFLVSRNGEDFVRFDAFYHRIFPSDGPVHPPANSYFFITDACNLGCSYCLNEANAHAYFGRYDLERFAADVQAWPGPCVGLVGGEPFSHPKFFEFARIVHAHGKRLRVCTNGLALAYADTMRRLIEVSGGDCEVRMTFEGFDPEAYTCFPVARVMERKVAALENLRAHNIPTALCLTFDPESSRLPASVRHRRMRGVLDYALQHDFVRAIAFQNAVAVGGARELESLDVISVDRCMDDIVAIMPDHPLRRHAYVGQKLMGVVTSLLRLPLCENTMHASLFRVGSQWVSLDHFLDCDALDRHLERMLARSPSSRLRLAMALLVALAVSARWRRAPSFLLLAAQIWPVFWHGLDMSRTPRSVLPIAATTACDRYNFDASIARRCDKWGNSVVRGQVVTELLSEMTIRQLRERELPAAMATTSPAELHVDR